MGKRETWVPFAAASRAANTYYSPGMQMGEGEGIWIALNITTASGFTLDVSVEVFDPATGWVVPEGTWAFAQKTAVGADQLWVHPHMTAAANDVIAKAVPTLFRIKAVVGTAACNFSVGVAEL